MDRTRRSLCGLGIAGVPLAVIAPKLLTAAQEPAQAGDPLLAYLTAETMRNCRAASRPGRGRAQYIRALGANVDMLSCYLHSRQAAANAAAGVRQRVRAEGPDALALEARDNWPRVASELARDYAVTPPGDLDHATLTTALRIFERRGLPDFHAVRRYLESQADAIDYTEGRTVSPSPTRQTPGSDYGPAGWNAGIGDPNTPSCYGLGVLLGLLAVLELIGEISGIVRPIMAILGLAITIACDPLSA